MCSATMAAPSHPVGQDAMPPKSSRARSSAKRPLGNGDSSGAARVHDENSVLPMRRTPAADTTAMPSITHRPPVSTGSAIRSRFLNRLGIQKGSSSSAASGKVSFHRTSLQDPQDTAAEESCSDDASNSSSAPPGCSLSYSSSFSSTTTTKTRSVSFDDSVTVRPIPRFDAYPLETKHQIWADPREIYENATRNSIEFAADNFDWQHAAEEEDFVPTETGDLVHPIHYVRQCNMQRNFLLVMAARQACK